jgi:hypothetical protein
MSISDRRLPLALAALLLASCAAPGATRDRSAVTESSGPRFAASGPNAEDYGASLGYPIGDGTSYYTTPCGETILVERDQYGRTDLDRFTSWSWDKAKR